MITKTFLETCSKVTAITENNCGKYFQSALREKCFKYGVFLVRLFLYSDQKKTPYLDTFTQWWC